ncbi:hypothetical protein B1J92_L11572g [Nakaseomyces glabratus]|nr:hypothetical protein B1J91_L11572g [Nakaseomyces glabratus]OXB46524.1 hypothetical protein B1J92_L11572g [Nakaseomyces glabratus]
MIRPRSNLGTLPEEPSVESKSGRTLAGITSSRKESGMRSRTSSGSAQAVGLGLGRRPSDNLFHGHADPLDTMQMLSEALPQPPKIEHGMRRERPISNDSIMTTKSSEIFSTSSSDTQSNISVATNDSEDHSFGMDKSVDNSSTNATLTNRSIENRSNGDSYSIGEKSDVSVNRSTKSGNNPLQRTQSETISVNMSHNRSMNGAMKQPTPPFMGKNSSIPNLRYNSQPQQDNRSVPNSEFGSKLYNLSNSTSAIIPNAGTGSKLALTPSQRYRLRKEQSEHALRDVIKRKEKLYDEQDGIIELQEGDIDGSFIFNVPMSSYSTTSFLNTTRQKDSATNSSSTITERITPGENQSQNNRESNMSFASTISSTSMLDFFEMPTSPIPGVNKVSDFQYLQDTTKHLSSVYLHSSTKLSKSKLSERTASADCLPLEFKEASEKGMEDLLLVSENKLDAVSHTRPSWLPPKDPEEKKLHEREISKTLSMASLDQLEKNKDRDSKIIKDETNKQKYVLLVDRNITRKSSLQSLKKIIWETPINAELRNHIYDMVLQSEARLVTERFTESFDDIIKLSNRIELTKTKEIEIRNLITANIENKAGGKYDISDDLVLMLKLKSISQQGILPGDELLFHHLLIDDSFENLNQVWEMVNLIQMTCFNEITKDKFDSKILEKSGVVASYMLQDDSFKHEFNANCLNSNTWWNILERVNHDLFMWIIDIIVTMNSQPFKNSPINKEKYSEVNWDVYRDNKVLINYQILISFALNVLLNYHFGFNDLKSLADVKDKNFCIPVSEENYLDIDEINSLFVGKWKHYFKKF